MKRESLDVTSDLKVVYCKRDTKGEFPPFYRNEASLEQVEEYFFLFQYTDTCKRKF